MSGPELEKIAFSLTVSALDANAVARLPLGDGMSMFVYPGDGFLIVGIGLSRDALRPATVDAVLRRRGQTPERYAAWIPAQFADGSFFVLLRLSHSVGSDVPTPPEALLDNALALLAA